MTTTLRPLALIGLLLLSPMAANAEQADRTKPVNIESDKVTVDELKKIHLFEGRVILTQGTLEIRGDTLTVTQDAAGFQKGVATSHTGLATFKQRLDGSGDYVRGKAERIEYDSGTQKTHLFNRAHVVSGTDEVRGQFIVYDGKTGQYVVTNSGSATADGGGKERVRVIIKPKTQGAAAPK